MTWIKLLSTIFPVVLWQSLPSVIHQAPSDLSSAAIATNMAKLSNEDRRFINRQYELFSLVKQSIIAGELAPPGYRMYVMI